MQTGRCLCGAVTWELSGDLIMTAICHCDHCQRQSGGAFSVNLIAARLAALHQWRSDDVRGSRRARRRRLRAPSVLPVVRVADRVRAREDRRRGRREGGHPRRQVSCPTGRRGVVRRPPALGLAARHRGLARPRVAAQMHRIFTTSVASVYPHYVAKVERKGRTKAELDQVIEWLTGYDEAALQRHLAAGTTFEDVLRRGPAEPERLVDHRGRVRGAGRGRRRSADAEDPLPRQAGRRARQGQADGEGPAHMIAVDA